MIKAVFFDIDGTLAGAKLHRMTESTKSALNQIKSAGVRIFLATGRHKQEIYDIGMVDGVEFDGAVTLNGQYCFAGEQVIHRNPICPKDIRRLVALLNQRPFPCAFLEEEEIYMNYVDDHVREEQEKIGGGIPPTREVERALAQPIYQVIPYVGREREAEILGAMRGCVISRWSDTVVDVIPAAGCKSKGIEQVLAYFGILREETMAFGDGRNDIDMLRYAGIGVAMGNARQEVKEAADYVTGSVDEDGVRAGLRYFGLL